MLKIKIAQGITLEQQAWFNVITVDEPEMIKYLGNGVDPHLQILKLLMLVSRLFL